MQNRNSTITCNARPSLFTQRPSKMTSSGAHVQIVSRHTAPPAQATPMAHESPGPGRGGEWDSVGKTTAEEALVFLALYSEDVVIISESIDGTMFSFASRFSPSLSISATAAFEADFRDENDSGGVDLFTFLLPLLLFLSVLLSDECCC